MAVQFETRRLTTEAEPVGLLTEGAAGIAVIVLAIIGLAGVSVEVLASIATIVIGVGLMVQAFNSAAEQSRLMAAATAPQMGDFGGEIMVDVMAGVVGIVLGILALIGVNAAHLVPIALVVFGGSLLLSGMIAGQTRGVDATSGIELLSGIAAIVLGILTLVTTMNSWVLVLAGFIVVGAAMLMVSASFTGAVLRLFTATTTTTTTA